MLVRFRIKSNYNESNRRSASGSRCTLEKLMYGYALFYPSKGSSRGPKAEGQHTDCRLLNALVPGEEGTVL